MVTIAPTTTATGRHRGEPRAQPWEGHCCFGGCHTHLCPRCRDYVCIRQGLHDCRPPYTGQHRAQDEA